MPRDYAATASRSIRLFFRSCSSNITCSEPNGAPLFWPAVGSGARATEDTVACLNTFVFFKGLALSGFDANFKGFVGLKAFSLRPPELDKEGVFGARDKTTFSDGSSRCKPNSTGGEGSLVPVSSDSACARSICSAINVRSRCSSEVLRRSFLSVASCELMLEQTYGYEEFETHLTSKSLRTAVYPSEEPSFLRLVDPGDTRPTQMLHKLRQRDPTRGIHV